MAHEHHHDHAHHDHDECKEQGCDCGHEHSEGNNKTLLLGGILYALGLLLRFTVGGLPADALLLLAYAVTGFEVLSTAAENLLHGEIFDECFLMSLSTLGALALREFPEAVAVMFFYRLGELLEDRAVDKSERSIEELLDIRPDNASVFRNGVWLSCPCEEISVGEHIRVQSGERIPLDGIVLEGSSQLDTKALTGESVPRAIREGETALSGCINLTALLTMEVTRPYAESTTARIIELVREASENKAPSENFIHRFAEKYTPAVVLLAVALALVPPLCGLGAWSIWLRRSFVFLVISCPCALVISVPLSFLGGIGAASQRGILCKGSNYLEALSQLDTVVFDKTGTLTEGVFELRSCTCAEGVTEAELLECAAAAEKQSLHPIALSVKAACGREIDDGLLSDARNYAGRGVGVRYKGAAILAGNEKLMEENRVPFTPLEEVGTKVYVSRDGQYLGCLLIADRVKAGAREAMDALRAKGVRKLCMLSGDSAEIAASVGAALGLDAVEGELLPEGKLQKLETLLQNSQGKLAYVGDGINDAPVLSRADVGIAMGALGSDAAIEAADVVLMTDELPKLAEAMAVARKTKSIVRQNIGFALGIKLTFLLLGALGIAGMSLAIIADVGVMVLCVLNAMRMLKIRL